MPLVFTTHSEDATITLGEGIGRALWAGDVLAIEGELGAGKTRLVRGIARGLGLDQSLVSSPTFVLVNHYPAPGADGIGLYHVDAYRLHGSDDLDAVGWDRVMDGSCAVAIEWASKLGDPRDWLAGRSGGGGLCRIELRHVGAACAGEDGADSGEGRRSVSIDAPASWTARPEWAAVVSLAEGAQKAGPIACPLCGKPLTAVAADAPHLPFCSERCKMADLGKWLNGDYAVSRELSIDDLDAQAE